tara:strand:- start:994 stop:1521 length:528 start_codon:yes stop_codon:yes gene_type:complete
MDDRLKKELGDSRRTRGHTDRLATENRAYTEDERLEMFRMQLYNDRLPNLPEIPGYHVCWLTTANTGDTIQSRSRMGYELIRAEDVPGMDLIVQKTGDYVGCVMVNEMIAAKLPTSLYLRYMQEAHHDAPLREEEKLEDTAQLMRDQAERSGGRLIESEAMREIGDYAPARGIFD